MSARGTVELDSRWWYWVAAVPVVVAFWILSAIWVVASVALAFGPDATTPGVGGLVTLPLVAVGVPLLVVVLVLPYAIYRDAAAVRAAGVGWDPDPAPYVAAAVAAFLAVLVPFVAEGLFPPTARWLLGGAAVLTWAGVALHYLRERRRHVPMP